MRHSLFSAALIGATLLMPAAHAAGYLQISDIPGESRARGHEGWIEILTMSEGFAMPDNGGAGRRTGTVQSSGITITREMDTSSPYLMNALLTGARLNEVKMEFTRAYSGTNDVFYTVELRNAVITGISTNVSEGAFEEELTLQYENITWTVHGPRDENDRSTDWDRMRNTSTPPSSGQRPTRAQ